MYAFFLLMIKLADLNRSMYSNDGGGGGGGVDSNVDTI